MARYSTLDDIPDDAMITIEERLLVVADTHVDSILFSKGIKPQELTLPQPVLVQLAVNIAAQQACIEQANGEESPLLAKSRLYQTMITNLSANLTRPLLGLDYPDTGGYATIKLKRA
jgi:hypothetical protein